MIYLPPEENPQLMWEIEHILHIVRARLNRGQRSEPEMNEYLSARIHAAIRELTGKGIHCRFGDPGDRMFIADYVCWQYSNRDKNEPMPEWLKLARRERWLSDGGETEENHDS